MRNVLVWFVWIAAFVGYGQIRVVSIARGQEPNGLPRIAESIAEALSWRGNGDVFSYMTSEGLADYCVQQVQITTNAGMYFASPEEIPDFSAIQLTLSDYGVNTAWPHAIPNLGSNLDFVSPAWSFRTNLKVRKAVLLLERTRLIKQLDIHKLSRLAAELHGTLSSYPTKPTHFRVGEVKVVGAKASVDLRLRGLQAEALADHTQSRSSPAALCCQFQKDNDVWKFAGFDFDAIYDNQVQLLESLSLKSIYLYSNQSDSNLLDPTSCYSLARSRQSEHFIIYWAKGYGEDDPNSPVVPAKLRVDIDELLEQAENYYNTNVKKLKIIEPRAEGVKARPKLIIFLSCTEAYDAYSNSCDEAVGLVSLSPTAFRFRTVLATIVSSCILHQLRCDLSGPSGPDKRLFSSRGDVFLYQSARFQMLQDFPNNVFESRYLEPFLRNCHRHFQHENNRFYSYYLLYFWQEKHGADIVGRVWREARGDEDPIQAYTRITGLSSDQFNDELFEAACRFASWDIDGLRLQGNSKIGTFPYHAKRMEDDFFRVSYEFCPGTTGFNVIPLSVPAENELVTIEFRGLENDPNYNAQDPDSKPGWRYGFVSLDAKGVRTYGAPGRAQDGQAEFRIKPQTQRLWFIVTGAPETYRPHTVDGIEQNDDQWPYELKVTGAQILNCDTNLSTRSDIRSRKFVRF